MSMDKINKGWKISGISLPPFCTTPQLHHRFSIRPPHYAATPPLSNRAIPPEKQSRRGGHSRPKKEISKIECFNDKGGRRGSITEILGTIHLNLCKKQESPFILVRDQKSQISNKCENQLDDVKYNFDTNFQRRSCALKDHRRPESHTHRVYTVS
ncbi:hypothetical protein LguiB_000617 [Lonicera macranthoides]